MRPLGLFLFGLLFGPQAFGQPFDAPCGHAHNDYEHDRPLAEALERGFCSVEADIFLVDGALLVAHDREDVSAGRTLESLYLGPLRTWAAQRKDASRRLLLLVDIKSHPDSTYRALRALLRSYADMVTVFSGETMEPGPVTVIVSGNRPLDVMQAETIRFAAYDGRLPDLETASDRSAAFMPLVSSHWSAVSGWQGEGEMPPDDVQRLRVRVRSAHGQHRLIRFWGTPDVPAVWRILYREGVDLINTDDLSGLEAFLAPAKHQP